VLSKSERKRYGERKVGKKQNGKIIIFCDVTPCSLADRYLNLGGTFCLHLHGTRHFSLKVEAEPPPELLGTCSPDWMSSHPRGLQPLW
jgi:hypothetical protein